MAMEAEASLVTRLVPSGVMRAKAKNELIGVVRYEGRVEAEEVLRAKRTGTIILRIDRDRLQKGTKSPHLIVSYKLTNTIFHRQLDIQAKVTQDKKKNEILIRVEPKLFRFVRNHLLPFLSDLFVFNNAMTKNKNWIEKELQQKDLEVQLAFRDFIIFPQRDSILVIRKTRTAGNKFIHKSLTLIMDLKKPTILVWGGEAVKCDFNSILLRFLEQDPNKPFLVKQALGYDIHDFDMAIKRVKTRLFLNSRSNTGGGTGDIPSREKSEMLSVIDLRLHLKKDKDNWPKWPSQIQGILEKIQSSFVEMDNIPSSIVDPDDVRAYQIRQEAERMEWIKKGIFKTLTRLYSECGMVTFDDPYDVPLDICTRLITNNRQACSSFFKTVSSSVNSLKHNHERIIGILYVLTKVIHVQPMQQVLLHESGIPALVSMYNRASTALIQSNMLSPTTAIGRVDDIPENGYITRGVAPPSHSSRSMTSSSSGGSTKRREHVRRGDSLPNKKRGINTLVSREPLSNSSPSLNKTSLADVAEDDGTSSHKIPRFRLDESNDSSFGDSGSIITPPLSPNDTISPRSLSIDSSEGSRGGKDIEVMRQRRRSSELNLLKRSLTPSSPKHLIPAAATTEEAAVVQPRSSSRRVSFSKPQKPTRTESLTRSNDDPKSDTITGASVKFSTSAPSTSSHLAIINSGRESNIDSSRDSSRGSSAYVPSTDSITSRQSEDQSRSSKSRRHSHSPPSRSSAISVDGPSLSTEEDFNSVDSLTTESVDSSSPHRAIIRRRPKSRPSTPPKKRTSSRPMSVDSPLSPSTSANLPPLASLVPELEKNSVSDLTSSLGESKPRVSKSLPGSATASTNSSNTPNSSRESLTMSLRLPVGRSSLTRSSAPKSPVPKLSLGSKMGSQGMPSLSMASVRQTNRQVSARPSGLSLNLTSARTMVEPPSPSSHSSPDVSVEEVSSLGRSPFKHSYREELKALAKKLGETSVSRDLTMLLQFKYEAEQNKERQLMKRSLSHSRQRKRTSTVNAYPLRGTPEFKVKVDILYVLKVLTTHSDLINHSPVNLLYSEICTSYLTKSLNDPVLQDALFGVLNNYAGHVELEHRLRWPRITKSMDHNSKRRYRNKLDLFLWRAQNRLHRCCDMDNLPGVQVQLSIIGDYMSRCRTRVMTSNVFDVSMETLLTIKNYIELVPLDEKHLENVKVLVSLLKIFDEMAVQTFFPPLTDFLLTLLVQKDQTFNLVESFATKVLISKEFETSVLSSHGREELVALRIMVVRHFIACVELIKKQFKTDDTESSVIVQEMKLEMLSKFSFLTFPNTGIVHRMLTQPKVSLTVKAHLLTFIHKLLDLGDPYSPLISDLYAESYISFHYLHFLRNYHNFSIEDGNLILCKKHLRILIDYAAQKNPQIRDVFDRLSVMDFLGHEINLEYEVKVMRKNYLAEIEKKKEEEKREAKRVEDLAKEKARKSRQAAREAKKHARRSRKLGSQVVISDTVEQKAPKQKPSMSFSLNMSGVALKGGPNPVRKPAPTSTDEDSSSSSSSSSSAPPAKPKSLGLKLTGLGIIKGGEHPTRAASSSTSSSSSESSSSESSSAPKKPHLGLTLTGLGIIKGGEGHLTNSLMSTSEDFSSTESSSEETSSSEAPPKTMNLGLKLTGLGIIKGGEQHLNQANSSSSDSSSSSASSSESSDESPPRKMQLGLKLTGLGIIKGGEGHLQAKKSVSSSEASTSESSSSEETSSSVEESPSKPSLSLKLTGLGIIKGGEDHIKKSPSTSSSSSSSSSSSESSSEEAPKRPAGLGLKLTGLGIIKGGEDHLKKDDTSESSSSSSESSSSSSETPARPAGLGLKLTGLGIIKGGDPEESSSESSSSESGPRPTGLSLKLTGLGIIKGEEMDGKSSRGPATPAGQGKAPPTGGSLSVGATATEMPNENAFNPKLSGSNHGTKTMTLSMMEEAVSNVNDHAKLQNILNQTGAEEDEEKEDELMMEEQMYVNERFKRKIYHDTDLHVTFMELVIVLLLDLNGFSLDELYTNQFPMRVLKFNIPFLVRLHLNHPSNDDILGPLGKKTQKHIPSAFRMLKLMSKRFFQPGMLSGMKQFAEGAYGRVYGALLLGEEVAVKQMDVPKNIHDRCVPHDIFAEITILDKWKQDARICRLIDFGVDDSCFWIVMKRYKTSLKDWREHQTKSQKENLLLYLNVFSDVLNVSRFLSENLVNHYDIKTDNYLIEPYDRDLTKEELYNQPTDVPNFTVCLADFGESLLYEDEEGGYTSDNRGTEFIKSPEMLTVAYASQVTKDTFDRRKKVGAGRASDIWSLGCLFFELLTDDFLFYDADWVRFFIRVTADTELVPPEKMHMLDDNKDLIGYLKYVLQRKEAYRPTLYDMIQRFKVLKQKINQERQHAERKRRQDEIKRRKRTSSRNDSRKKLKDKKRKTLNITNVSATSTPSPTPPESEASSPRSSPTKSVPLTSSSSLPNLSKSSASIDNSHSNNINHGNSSPSSPMVSPRTSPFDTVKETIDDSAHREESAASSPSSPRESSDASSSHRTPSPLLGSPAAPPLASELVATESFVESTSTESGSASAQTSSLEAVPSPTPTAKEGGEVAADSAADPATVPVAEAGTGSISETTTDLPTGGPPEASSPTKTPTRSGSSSLVSSPDSSLPTSPREGAVAPVLEDTEKDTHVRPEEADVADPPTSGEKGDVASGISTPGDTSPVKGAATTASDSGSGSDTKRSPAKTSKKVVGTEGSPTSTVSSKISNTALDLTSLPSPSVEVTVSPGGGFGGLSDGVLLSPMSPLRTSHQKVVTTVNRTPTVNGMSPRLDSLEDRTGTKKKTKRHSTVRSLARRLTHKENKMDKAPRSRSRSARGKPKEKSVSVVEKKRLTDQQRAAVLRAQLEEEQRKALELIAYESVKYTEQELSYFQHQMTKITTYLYLGTLELCEGKYRELMSDGITHIVNCSSLPNPHASHFEYLNLNLTESKGDIGNYMIKNFDTFFEFVRNAGKMRGRVLVASEDSSAAPAMVIGFLMENRLMTFFESWQFVHKRRYVINLAARHIQQLIRWEKSSRQKIDIREYFQCICKKNKWILLLPFDKTQKQNPVPCNCQYDDYSDCPNHGCATFCESMSDRHPSKFRDQYLKWGYTERDHLQGEFEHTEEYIPAPPAGSSSTILEAKNWRTYRCRSCLMMTHAESSTKKHVLAIVTNIHQDIKQQRHVARDAPPHEDSQSAVDEEELDSELESETTLSTAENELSVSESNSSASLLQSDSALVSSTSTYLDPSSLLDSSLIASSSMNEEEEHHHDEDTFALSTDADD